MATKPTGYFVIEKTSRRVRSLHASWPSALRYMRDTASFEGRAVDDFGIGVADPEFWASPFVDHGDWTDFEDLRSQSVDWSGNPVANREDWLRRIRHDRRRGA